MISEDDIQKLANLARLEVEDSLKAIMAGQVSSIVEYVAQLNKVDTTDIAPTSHTNEVTNVMRDDVVWPPGSQPEPQPLGETSIPKQAMLSDADLFQNAPDRSGRYIRVPLIVE